MKKFLPILIVVLLLFPFVANAGLADIIRGIFDGVICILFHVCPDPCSQLLVDVGPASWSLCRVINRIASALYLIGWSLAGVVILWGGISIMVAGGNEDQMKRGKAIIKSGLIGAAIVLCAGFILSLLLDFLYPLFVY